jgi:hypothetical protein
VKRSRTNEAREALLTSWTVSSAHFNEEKVETIEEIFHFYFRMAPRRPLTDAKKEEKNRSREKNMRSSPIKSQES